MKAFLSLDEPQIEALYYVLSSNEFEFEDEALNGALERVFDQIVNAYEDMHAPIDEEEEEYLEERFK